MISVLLPTYNCATTIGHSIRSVLNQTILEIELLVLDDGSTDGTETVISQLSDHRIRYSKLSHEGLTKTLNHGLSIAKYDIIARMDADDLCVQTRFERQLKVLDQLPENYLLSSWYAVVSENKIQYIVRTPTKSEEIKKGLLLHSYISHPGLMCHKKTLIDCGGYVNNVEVDAFQDYETWLNMKGKVEFAVIPEVLMFQRYREQSLSNDLRYKQKVMYAIQQPYYNNLLSHFGISDRAEESLFRGWREYFYGSKKEARKYWMKLGFSVLKHPRIILAWFVTYMPEGLFIKFKESRMKFRLQYIGSYFFPSIRTLNGKFKSLTADEAP